MTARCAAAVALAMLTLGCVPPPPATSRPANQPTGPTLPNIAPTQTIPGASSTTAEYRPSKVIHSAKLPTANAPPTTLPATAATAAVEQNTNAIKPLTQQQQDEVLAARLRGGMGHTFSQFANMFLVASRIQFGVSVGLMTADREIAKTELQSPFPEFYEPTLREFLDAIALQTFSQWKYDPTDNFFESDVPRQAPVAELAFFEFTKAKRAKPYTIKLADGWKSEDKGNWSMLIPPSFPVGLDIYEMGTYSADDGAKRAELLAKVRDEVALEWAKRANPDARVEDLKPAKVGSYDALFFTTMVPTHLGKEMRWRQWVFMVDNKCYFVVSTILPKLDAKIFPDVEKMLGTFAAVKP